MKIRFLIIALIIVITSVSICLAQDWDTFLNNYDKNQIDKPVTPQVIRNSFMANLMKEDSNIQSY